MNEHANQSQSNLAVRQNEPREIGRLAAQRVLYSRAKLVFCVATAASLLSPILWTPAATIWPSLKPWAALYGLGITLIDIIFLEPYQRRTQKIAASIQELFDCYVFNLAFNKLKLTEVPSEGELAELAQGLSKKAILKAPLKDWYPPALTEVRPAVACIIGQRENLLWDTSLKGDYADRILQLVLGISLLTVAVGLSKNSSLSDFLLGVVVPLLPTVLWGAKEFRKHREAVEDGRRLLRYSQTLIDGAAERVTTDSELNAASRALQDEVFDRRRRGPIVLDFFYRWLLPKYEKRMHTNASEYVKVFASQAGTLKSESASPDRLGFPPKPDASLQSPP